MSTNATQAFTPVIPMQRASIVQALIRVLAKKDTLEMEHFVQTSLNVRLVPTLAIEMQHVKTQMAHSSVLATMATVVMEHLVLTLMNVPLA